MWMDPDFEQTDLLEGRLAHAQDQVRRRKDCSRSRLILAPAAS